MPATKPAVMLLSTPSVNGPTSYWYELWKSYERNKMQDQLTLIKQQLESYHLALDLRQHGGVAAQNFVHNVEKILEMPWVQGEAQKRAGNASRQPPKEIVEVKEDGHAGGEGQEKVPGKT